MWLSKTVRVKIYGYVTWHKSAKHACVTNSKLIVLLGKTFVHIPHIHKQHCKND